MNQFFSKLKEAFASIVRKFEQPGKPNKAYAAGGRASRHAGRPAGRSKGSFAYALEKKKIMILGAAAAVAVVVPVAIFASGGVNAQVASAAVPNDTNAAVTEGTEVAALSATPEAEPVASNAPQPVVDENTINNIGEMEGSVELVDSIPDLKLKTETGEEFTLLNVFPEMQNPDVIPLQERLMALNYLENDEPTEYYGPATQEAVKYFQRKHGLAVDGYAGEETQRVLFASDAKPYSVTVGGEGLDVEHIQSRLKELGYTSTVSGYFGTDTEKAVKYFQRMNGLDDDGSVGVTTKDLLFSETAEPALAQPKKSKKPSGGSSSSGGGGKKPSTNVTANPGSVSAFIDAAYSLVGVPYVLGGKSSSGLDCSGFVYLALQLSGNGIGYMTSGGWAGSDYPTVGSMSELQAGDIVCFKGHVGVYVGGGTMVDASSSQGVVRVASNIQGSNYWTSNFICGKRPL